MKNCILVICTIVGLLLLNSCASLPVLDQGFYSDGEEQQEVAKITVDKYLIITGIDKTSGTLARGIKTWENKKSSDQIQEFTLNKGVHTISVEYNDGAKYTAFSEVLIANFEANKEYKVISTINSKKVTYDIIDTETSKSAVLDLDSLHGKTENVISKFINAVINPTMEGVDKTVIEENDDYILTALPNMKYELINKKDNSVEKGYRGFITDFSFKKGTVYLYETDSISTKEEFLKTDYTKTSQIILEVKDCDLKTVTYTYVKPENLAGKTITFTISVQE